MIPNRVFFVWFGNKIPMPTGLAILSAKQVQKPDETILYIDSEEMEMGGEGYDLIKGAPGVEIRKIDESIFEGLGDGGVCSRLYKLLKKPVSKTNLLRYALLYKQGGVYLDTDIIAVKPWDDLLRLKGFCGLEPVAFPQKMFASRNPLFYLFSGLRFLWRLLCVYLPHGEQIFRPTEWLFSLSANGAILGSEAGNEFFEKAFAEINAMPEKEQLRHFRLGTHIMQKVTGNKSSEIMKTFPPAYFYPVGPDISAHLFRAGSASRLEKILQPQTRIIHWYNSVEKKYLRQKLDLKWLEEHPSSAFARLAREIMKPTS